MKFDFGNTPFPEPHQGFIENRWCICGRFFFSFCQINFVCHYVLLCDIVHDVETVFRLLLTESGNLVRNIFPGITSYFRHIVYVKSPHHVLDHTVYTSSNSKEANVFYLTKTLKNTTNLQTMFHPLEKNTHKKQDGFSSHFFRIFEMYFLNFVVAIFDLVYGVEAIHDLC